jgi:CMP-N-acetylneuraminic acid synthetase
MSCISIIPARGGSVGVPRKNLQPINGTPLLAYAIRAASKATSVHRIIVSTDTPEIADLARAEGAEVVMRPASISGCAATSESAISHAAQQLGLMRDEILLFMQCTNPLTLPQDLDLLFETFSHEKADCAFTVTSFHGFLWRKGENGSAEAINHSPAKRLRRQDCPPEFIENGAAYMFRAGDFLKHQNRFFGRTIMVEMPGERTIDIDTPEDLQRASEMLARQNSIQRN